MLSIFFIGIALSMDAFSVALSLSLINIKTIKGFFLIFNISLFHYIMPMMGNILGDSLMNIISINSHFIVTVIFLYLAIMMYIDGKKEKNYMIESILSIILIAFSVSIDSFSVGIGLSGLTEHKFLSFLVFSLCSGSITYMGFIIGKYLKKQSKIKSEYLSSIILITLAIVNLCKMLFD